MWRYVYEAVNELKKADKIALFKAIKQDLYPKEETKMDKILPKIKESRFSSGLGCLHCGSTAIKRNGKYRSKDKDIYVRIVGKHLMI